jgi:hypothetical protein
MANPEGKPVKTTKQLITVHVNRTHPFVVVALDSDVRHFCLRGHGAPENDMITCREDSEINPAEGLVDLDVGSAGIAAYGPAFGKIVSSLNVWRTYSYVVGHAGHSVRNVNDGPKLRITNHRKFLRSNETKWLAVIVVQTEDQRLDLWFTYHLREKDLIDAIRRIVAERAG